MSDDSQTPEDAPSDQDLWLSLSFDEANDIAEFLNLRAEEAADRAGDPCLHCGSNDTYLENELSFVPTWIDKDAVPTMKRGKPVISLVCNNCGHIRFFSLNYVRNMIERNKEEE